jgi:hypothetical protein
MINHPMSKKVIFFISIFILAFIPGGIFMSFILLLIYYGKNILEYLGIQNQEQDFEIESEYDISDPSDLDRFWHPTWGFSSPKTEYDSETQDSYR